MAMTGFDSTPQRVLLSYEDLRTLPEDGRRYEILEGELSGTAAPTTSHQRTSRNLVLLLCAHVEPRQLGEVFHAPIDVILDRQTIVQPDILFVATPRLGMISERAIEGPPDLVIEIASPATEQHNRGAKQQLYARFGVSHYWRVDPSARTLTELVLQGSTYALRATHGSDAPLHTGLFPELAIDLAAVLRTPPTRPTE